MTTRQLPVNDYRHLAARFSVVRRAWKRAAALSGLAIVVTESIGILTGLLFLDWLYQPLPMIRIGVGVVALAGIVYLLARHVVKPLLRDIPDEQIALYMEENRAELDGVLITAVEYGRKRDHISRNQALLVDAVVREATDRSARIRMGRIIDFSRFRKYGIGAVAGIGLYVLLSALFPHTFGYHIGRVLRPWYATEEDRAKRSVAAEKAAPLRLTLSKGNTSLPRGSAFEFEATLSKTKPPEALVELYFRPHAGGTEWQHLAMSEIEKLNGFQGAIPDVSEDMDFYVTCGEVRSETYQVTIYDPLVVQSLEMTIHSPDYLKLPDQVQRPYAGDLTAVVGSTATLRILTSTPLKEGQIKWNNGQTQAITVDPKANKTAVVSFEVKEDGTYDYSLTDANGQQAASAAPLSVHAIPDLPPTVRIKSPESPVLTQPVGEIDFQAEAGDDFGVTGIDLVYALLDDKGEAHETRVPLKLGPGENKDDAHSVTATYPWMLEDANPPFQPNDAISYHLEARDAKGQVTNSEIGFVIVGYYEHWSTWGGKEAFSLHQAGPSLMSILNTTWQLDSKRPHLEPADFQKQSQDIASQLMGPDGVPNDFIYLNKFPQLARLKDIINARIIKAHAGLLTGDTPSAVTNLSAAVALIAGGQLKQDSVSHLDDQVLIGGTTGVPAFTLLELTRAKALEAANDKTHEEKNPEAAKKAAEMAKKVEELRKNQEDLIAQAGAPEPAKDKPAGNGAATGQGKPDKADLAQEQHELADKTRSAAQAAKEGQRTGAGEKAKMDSAADKTNEAAGKMEEAARDFAAGKNEEAQAKAGEAKAILQVAGELLHNTDLDKLEASISAAARRAVVLLEKQQDLGAKTGALATDLGANKPDQRQQRDLQAEAYQETGLEAEADALGTEIGELNQVATQVGQPEAIRELTEAQRIIKRTPPQVKMADAVIDLNNATPIAATQEQKDAEAALAKIIESLKAGSDSLAANRDAQLARAARAAQDAKDGIKALQGKGGDQAQSGDQANPQDAPENASGGGDDIRKLAYNLNELTTVIDQGQIVAQDEVDRLKEMSMDKAALEKRLAIDPKFLQDVSDIVGDISGKIEAEMTAKAEAGKLFSSQREECPPNYRQFVNKYFEVLSQTVPAPAPAGQPAPTTGQP